MNFGAVINWWHKLQHYYIRKAVLTLLSQSRNNSRINQNDDKMRIVRRLACCQ